MIFRNGCVAETHVGDCLTTLRRLPDGMVHTCVTSPPYFGLRDYGVAAQIGLEATPDEFVAKLVEVFREVRRVLRDDGTLWLNLGDSYANDGKVSTGLKAKDLIGIPWRVAFALQADGWYLRQDIIWSKPNPMPESVTDRCTKAHEYVFLLSKSERYHFDHEAIKEPLAASSVARLAQDIEGQGGSTRANGNERTERPMKAVRFGGNKYGDDTSEESRTKSGNAWEPTAEGTRNKRSVWAVATRGFKGAHFATFPPALIEPCVLAGAPLGGVVLDPFGGSGTTAAVALKHGRHAVLCELNPEYAALVPARIEALL